jgi:hypothetical protein
MAPVLALAVLGLLAAPWFPQTRALAAPLPCLLLAAALALPGGLALAHASAGRLRRAALVLVAGAVVFEVLATVLLVPGVERLKVAPRLAASVRAAAPAAASVATLGFEEPSLTFYLRRPIVHLPGPAEAAAWARGEGAGVLIVPRPDLAALRAAYPALPLCERPLASASGMNLAKGRWVDLLAVARCAPAGRPGVPGTS